MLSEFTIRRQIDNTLNKQDDKIKMVDKEIHRKQNKNGRQRDTQKTK